jgi:leucyl aminopeptidase
MCGTTSRVLQGVYLARDLVNEPASVATPAFLAEQALVHCRGRGLKVEVWTKKRIEKERLAGLLAVSRGSTEEPRFIKISYQGGGPSKKKIALIGKGITFDSGGLSLKTPKAMETMKRDMAGAAAVIGVMSLLPDLGLRLDVQGYIPATDNLPSGAAQKPGDIIRYANGRSVEVLNTDAEGRLILADALDLAARSGADFIIDVATLTGACVVALGQEIAGVMGNDQELIDLLFDAGRRSDEGLWQLPLPREYREEIKSTIADIKNVGGGSAGAITAALFLQEFVGKSPWAHLDIAGPAFWEKDSPFGPAGGTGFGVKTLAHFLMGLSGRSLSR